MFVSANLSIKDENNFNAKTVQLLLMLIIWKSHHLLLCHLFDTMCHPICQVHASVHSGFLLLIVLHIGSSHSFAIEICFTLDVPPSVISLELVKWLMMPYTENKCRSDGQNSILVFSNSKSRFHITILIDYVVIDGHREILLNCSSPFSPLIIPDYNSWIFMQIFMQNSVGCDVRIY